MVAKAKKSKKSRKSAKKTQVSQSIKKYVSRVLHKTIENKVATFRNAETRLYNITNDVTSWRSQNIIYLSPRQSGEGAGGCIIAQGVGQGARIGNKINIRKAVMNYVIYPYSSNYATSQGECLDICVYIFKTKSMNLSSDIENMIETAFFQDGSSDVPLTGLLEDCVLQMNKDVLIPYKRWVEKLGPATVGSVAVNAFNSNDYKYNIKRTLDVTKYLYKTYDFNDDTNQPNNDATIIMFSPVPPQNDTEGTGTNTFYMAYNIQIEYEDA